MNIFRMLSAILRGLSPHPDERHIRALQSAYAREAALQSGRGVLIYDAVKVRWQDMGVEWKRK